MKKSVSLVLILTMILYISACNKITHENSLSSNNFFSDSSLSTEIVDINTTSFEGESSSVDSTFAYDPPTVTQTTSNKESNKDYDYLNFDTPMIPNVKYSTQISALTSKNKISQKFLTALNNSGFDSEMNHKKLQNVADKITLTNGESMYKKGFVYKSKDLYGIGYAYGELNNCISYDSGLKEFDTNRII